MSDNIKEEKIKEEEIKDEVISNENMTENNSENNDEPEVTTIFKDGRIEIVDTVPEDVMVDLKTKYDSIFGIYINGKPVLYRRIGIDDYIHYQNIIAEEQNKIQKKYETQLKNGEISEEKLSYEISSMWDEKLVELFVIYPENIIDLVKKGEYPGGAIYTIAQGILSNNGFVELEPVFISKKSLELDKELLNVLDDEILKNIDGIDKDMLKTWIDEYDEIAMILFYNKLYIVRGFKYDEYGEIKELTAKLPTHMLNIELVRKFMLFPKIALNSIPAGIIIQVLPELILSLSGFSPSVQPDIIILDEDMD